MALLSVENVRKSYGSLVTLDGISFHVDRGECVALLGPSGCGKSTLLNIIAGFLQPDSGNVTFEGRNIVSAPPNKRDMGMVFQDYALFPHLSVIENLEFGPKMKGVPARERRAPAMEALELVGLKGMENRGIRQLSGGQQQRVAVARALVNKPRLLLFDEPLSNLDARLRDTMRSEIRTVLDRTKLSAIFVTHDQTEAFSIADRVALMNKGRIVQIGRSEDIYEHPATRFVASFLGGCNLITGTIEQVSADGLAVRTEAGRILAAKSEAITPASGAPVSLAVRPHHIAVGTSETAFAEDERNVVECKVASIEYLGAVTRVALRREGGLALFADVPDRPQLAVGDLVEASWPRRHTWPVGEDHA